MCSRDKILLLSLVLTLATGCATQGEKRVQSYSKTRETLAESHRTVDITLLSLDGLRRTPADHLKDAFRQYKDSVDKLQEQASAAKTRAAAMKEDSEMHIKTWQSEMSDIKDPTIKSTVQSRRDAVRSNFKLLQMYADDARKAYQPFIAGNQDIIRALSVDLSPAAINSLSQSIDKVLLDGNELKMRISAMQRGMDNIANGVSPIGL